jgi:hypothetical protein
MIFFFCSFTFLRVFFFLFFPMTITLALLKWHLCLLGKTKRCIFMRSRLIMFFPSNSKLYFYVHSKNRSHLTWTFILLTILKRTIINCTLVDTGCIYIHFTDFSILLKLRNSLHKYYPISNK